MRIAVIGAGFSGMLAAYLLEKQGFKVTIYEKQEYIGGHCRSIISRDVYTELGTVFSFSRKIKELLIELNVDYKEHFIYKDYVDENYNQIEVMSREDVSKLVRELKKLEEILSKYSDSLMGINYGYIHDDLMISFYDFTIKHDLKYVRDIMSPFFSSFGFACTLDTQAYYVFKAFNIDTLYTFIRGEKLLSFNKGISELISKLSQNISDIRYSIEVKNIEVLGEKIKVESAYSSDLFDKVLISTKLDKEVIKDSLYNKLMQKIESNPFITCVFEVINDDIATTYYKSNLGKKGKIQFFFASKKMERTTLVAYAYGFLDKSIVDDIRIDIEGLGIVIKQLVTAKQWHIFPHVKKENLKSSFYSDIDKRKENSNIELIGSLVCEPSIDSIYISIKESIDNLIDSNIIN